MIRIYILQAIRSLRHQKMHFLIILLGVSVSLASAFLIYSYIFFENSYDSFYPSHKNLYRIVVDAQQTGKDAYKSAYSFSAQGPTAKEEVPEVEDFVRIASASDVILSTDDNSKQAINVNDYYYADDNFFELFSFPLIQGSVHEVLQDKESAVLSESLTHKLFGTANPIGKTILVDGKWTKTVTGVMKDIPENTHLKFDMIFPIKSNPWMLRPQSKWTNHSYFTYVTLKEDADPIKIEKKITSSFIKENRAVNQVNCVWRLQPVDEAYLNTADFTSKPSALKFGDSRMVYFLIIITILIMSVSWVNYINLMTARKDERLDEVKVRKVNGANKRNLIIQFFTESVFQNILGILMACFLIAVSFRPFADIMGFSVEIIKTLSFWTIPAVVLLLSIVLPGLFSAFSLSRHKAHKKPYVFSRFSLRDAMLVLQFIIIIALLSSGFVINKQMKYIHQTDLGFDTEQILVLNIPRVSEEQIENNVLETFRSDLMQYPDILDVSATTTVPGNRFGNGDGGLRVSGQTNEDTYFRIGRVMENYPGLMNFKFVAGQSFSDSDNEIVINEAAVKELGFTNARDLINQSATFMGQPMTIVGVTEDFHQESLHILPEPQVMFTKNISTTYNNIVVKVSQENVQNMLSVVEKSYKTRFSGNPLNYFFLDKYFNHQYQKDIKFRKLFSLFSIIALIIGYIGMYGLTTFNVVKRTKEIGVRKVNGAKISEVLLLLNKEFVKWVSLAFIIATPIAWLAMDKWLENFAYKTSLSWWIFVLAGVLALSIALLTVSWQSWKAATRNPVEALRYE